MRNRFRIGVAAGLIIVGIAGCREGREIARGDYDADGTATGDGVHGEAGGSNGAGGAAMGSGGSGGAPYPGTGGALDAGAPDHPSGTGGMATGTGGARAGTGGMGVGGMGAPGTGVGGTIAGTGGMGVGGTIVGTGGMGVGGTIAGTGGATPGTGGSPPNLLGVAQALNGQMLLVPCLLDTAASVCSTQLAGCPAANATDRALSGALLTDSTVMLAGTTGQAYTITLHVQGEVSSKTYTGSVDANNVLASPMANGFATGGTPTTADAYEVFMLRVTNPGGATHTDYFLNSLAPPGVSNHTTYGIDYTAQIQAQGGATIRLVASDPNCSAIKNCGPVQNDGTVCAGPIVLSNVEPTVISMNPTISFTVPYNGEWIALTVKDVTSP